MIKKILYILVTLFMFTLSWTDTFSVGEWFPLHVVFITIMIPFFVIQSMQNGKIKRSSFKKEDIFLLFFIGILMFSLLVNYTPKSINYIAAYILVFIFEVIILKVIIYNNVNLNHILKINKKAVIFVSIFVLLEFSLKFFLNINIQNFFPRSRANTATYLGILPRTYGFATEPGVLAFYYTTMGPIAVWYIWSFCKNNRQKILFTSLIALAFVTTFSSAGIFFALVASFLSIFLKINKSKTVKTKLSSISAFILIILVISLAFVLNDGMYQKIKDFSRPIHQKITLSSDVGSSQDRQSRWIYSIESLLENPFSGKGLGSTSLLGRGSSTNWYLFLATEVGVFALVPILIYLFITLIKIINSKNDISRVYLISFIAGSLHLSVMSTFYHPFLWILIVLFNYHNDCLNDGIQYKSDNYNMFR